MTYITLLKPKGKGVEAIRYLKELNAPEGVTIKDKYFVFGQYDAAIIFEAINDKIALNFIMELGFATDYKVETLVAVSTKEE